MGGFFESVIWPKILQTQVCTGMSAPASATCCWAYREGPSQGPQSGTMHAGVKERSRRVARATRAACRLKRDAHMMHFFAHKNSLFAHNRFSTVFFSMKMAELENIILVSCNQVIDFDDYLPSA